MKKSLSLVVAIALVFSLLTPAMAFAATSQEIAAGAKLKEYGVLTGNTQGDLLLDLELDREDMIVLLSRLMGVEEEAAATENTHGWDDVTDPFYHGYISWAKNEGLTKGVGDGSKFGYDQKMTVQELLQFQLRALGYEVEWNDVPAKAVELGLVAEGEDMAVNATRGKMAVVTLQALNTPVNGENIVLGAKLGIEDFIPDVGILSFNAVGAKKLEVKFASAVDTEEAKVTVKRGTVTVNVSDIKWSSDKKVATIETASRLVEGTYTVSVEGVAEEALTASVDVENEKVESIEILNDVAPIDRDNTGQDLNKQVVVHYVVKNQYGENVSNIYVPTASASGKIVENANGVLKIAKDTDFIIQETVFVSLVYIGQNYTVSAQKNLTVGLSAKADAVEVTGIYNEDEEAVLDSDVSADEAGNFKLLLDVKDQYGNPIKDINILKNDLIVTVGGTHILEVAYEGNNIPAFELVEINGENVVALPLAAVHTSGTAVVNVVPKYSGKSANYSVVVEEGLVYDRVILSPVSSIVAVNEEVLVPVTVLDSKGNTVTDAKKLNDALFKPNGIGVEKIRINLAGPAVGTPEFVTKDGNLYLKFKADNYQGTITVSAVTESYKSSYLNIEVKAAAYPRVIVGLKSDVNKLIFEGDAREIKADKVLVEDNYGRIMSEDALKSALANEYRIFVEATGKVTVKDAVYAISDSVAVNLLAGNDSGNTSVKFTLAKKNAKGEFETLTGSQWSTAFRAVTMPEISEIEIEDVETLYAGENNNKYAKEVKVVGITKDGKRVPINYTADNFTVISLNNNVAVKDGNKVLANKAILKDENSETTVKVSAVLANGLSAEKEVKVSNEAPKVNSVEIKKVDGVDVNDGVVEVAAGTTLNINSLTLEIKDQYGVQVENNEFGNGTTAPDATSLTFSNLPSGTKVSGNGTATATYTAEAGQEFTVTVKFGSVSASVKVKVK